MTRIDVAPQPPSFTTPTRYSSILVAVDGTAADDRALATAVALAAEDPTLTLFATSRAPHWSFLALGFVAASAACAPREQAAAALRCAAFRVPSRFGVRSLIGTGGPGMALAEEAARGGYDLAVVVAPACRRLARACAAPLLVIPATSPTQIREVPR